MTRGRKKLEATRQGDTAELAAAEVEACALAAAGLARAKLESIGKSPKCDAGTARLWMGVGLDAAAALKHCKELRGSLGAAAPADLAAAVRRTVAAALGN